MSYRPTIRDVDRQLFDAAESGDVNALLAALAAGADPAVKDHALQTPLHVAAEFGKTDAARILIEKLVEKGAEINPQNRWQQTPIHWAAQNGHMEIARMALDNGKPGDIDIGDYRKYTVLHWAVEKNNINLARMFVEKGANIHAETKWRQTPIDFAKKHGFAPIVEMLEEAERTQQKDTDGKGAVRPGDGTVVGGR